MPAGLRVDLEGSPTAIGGFEPHGYINVLEKNVGEKTK
jgi:hypothetical protein